jgi:DNA mismatch repair protein MSH4
VLLIPFAETHDLALELKYDTARQYYIRIHASEVEDRGLPDLFINQFRRKNIIECQTLDLLKSGQKIMDSHHEVLQMSDRAIQELISAIRDDLAPLFKISDAIALLDMLAAFAQLVTTQDYTRPEMAPTLAIKDGRHPIREKIDSEKFIPNDAYATQQSRFQIITGCNMSGKSTYIRSLALMAIMAQVGSFVPASYASFPIFHQLFARVSMDEIIEANVSTYAAEMRETAFILRNVNKRSMVIIDELGRGTSTRDGLAIAIAVSEALIDSKAFVWFTTHFRDLATILAERNGVLNLHLAVEMGEENRMTMLYKIAQGSVQEKHYGIALARVLNLPPLVLQIAEEVSNAITLNVERRKKTSKTILIARRRKLLLSLKEQLFQTYEGKIQGVALLGWLKKLQEEFVIRMDAINAEIAAIEGQESVDELNSQDHETLSAQSEGEPMNHHDITVRSISPGDYRAHEKPRYEMTGALQVATDHDE